AGGEKYLLDDSLTTLEAKLPEPFLRVSRSAIVNGEKVAEMLKFFDGRYVLQMTDKPRSQISTGSTYLPRLKAWLGWG
ncbi:MAG: LytTR family transcriptional regulator, partial [Microscillaceae bacterium]|nr:LytTR family transcriptional regulator [Microscillaceae bacterium]